MKDWMIREFMRIGRDMADGKIDEEEAAKRRRFIKDFSRKPHYYLKLFGIRK